MSEVVDLERLDVWMDQYGLPRGLMADATMLAGGTQNILLRFRRGNHEYVLRRPPIQLRTNSNDAMRREATILHALGQTDVPHPKLIAACSDEAILGSAFYLMELVSGFNATTGMPALHSGSATLRHRMGLAMVEGITKLAALDYRGLGLEHFGHPENYLERQVTRWVSQLNSYSSLSGWNGLTELPGVEPVASWLEINRPSSFQAGIMHGDYHIANVMFRYDSPEIAAIIDWELSTIGDPLLDLGWLLATWPSVDGEEYFLPVEPWEGFPSAEELISHYRARTSRDMHALPWYAVLACFKLAIILEGTYARACAGMAERGTGEKLHRTAKRLIERANVWIRTQDPK